MTHRTLVALVISVLVVGAAYAQPCAFSTNAANITNNCGNVGIGNATPVQKLDIIGNPTNLFGKITNQLASGTSGWQVQGDGGPGNCCTYQAEFGVRGTARATYGALIANDGYMYSNGNFTFMADNATTGALKFASGGNVERMRVDTNGNVGIGVAAPTQKLDVAGNINVSGNINAKYQDVAEWVESSTKIEPGTVVVLDPARINEVVPSGKAYDTSAAGVISAKPGISLGEASPTKVQVATSGRVRVKVDATKSPIRIGDLLVTSDKPGMAMKSQPIDFNGISLHRPGTLIGKALEPLDKGEGEILVLLSMQ